MGIVLRICGGLFYLDSNRVKMVKEDYRERLSAGAGVVVGGGTVAGIGAVISGLGITVLFAQTGKSNGYYGERWPGDLHKPDHVHLRGYGIDIRIGRDGLPLEGEGKLSAQASKALKKLWKQFVELFNRW